MIEVSYVCLSNNQRCIATCSISTWKLRFLVGKWIFFVTLKFKLSWISKVYLFWLHSWFLANLWTNLCLIFNIVSECLVNTFWWKMCSILLIKRNSNWKQISSFFRSIFAAFNANMCGYVFNILNLLLLEFGWTHLILHKSREFMETMTFPELAVIYFIQKTKVTELFRKWDE